MREEEGKTVPSSGEPAGATHPAAYRLDAVAAGDDDEEVSGHMRACDECAAYVGTLRHQAKAFREGSSAQDHRARALARLRGRRRARVIGIALPLVAAAVLLMLRARPMQQGSVPRLESAAPAESGEARFKGKLSVIAIRERDGQQERIVGPFTVRASDRVRIEVSVDRDGPVTAGLLTDGGDWIVLLAPVALAAGTHYSEQAARFDETPTKATLLVGRPSAVDRARRTRDFEGLVAWRVTNGP
jgi:hypothetical protein